MPELPEVETVRRQIAPLVRDRRVTAAGAHPSARFVAAEQAVGSSIVDVRRRGKYLLVDLDDDRELVVHLGMTGGLRVCGGDQPRDPYVRAWWDLDDGHRLELRDVRRFGRVAVVPTGDHSTLATLQHLGPEPFDEAFTPEALYDSLRRSRQRVKTQLLSQRPVAGVGNIYADEALWESRVHPAARRVTRAEAARLHEALRRALDQGVRNGGTTLRDYRAPDGREGRNQGVLACYGRAGEPCLRCGGALRRAVLDGRGTTWCPSCQRRR